MTSLLYTVLIIPACLVVSIYGQGSGTGQGPYSGQGKHSGQGKQSEEAPEQGQCVRCCPQDNPPGPQIIALPQQMSSEKGDKGDPGWPGPVGVRGPTGTHGPPGLDGARGPRGPPAPNATRPQAAFSVLRASPMFGGDRFQAITFEHQFVNIDQHFNNDTGVFYCMISGIYHFSYTLHTYNGYESYVHLMKNEEEQVINFSQSSGRSIMQTQFALLPLDKGDRIWLRLAARNSTAIFSDSKDFYITFNGYLAVPQDYELSNIIPQKTEPNKANVLD
ncbi:C1QTNF1 [Branchiostoma lanceolatum]|uniref:C1QTNF1 protein n=1 Tax=Branchiostoma lanceolatum TaxID=7740 RepID=A0A8K0F071_BRALA|nr:C1QTNF1 [Branchiostoma lanceolatum]